MGRYLKYLEIVNKLDSAIEKKTSGKVDLQRDLPVIKMMLETQKLALEMSMCIDRIDDNVKSAFKLYAKGDPSARGVVEEVLEKMKEQQPQNQQHGIGGESNSNRDFRSRREDSQSNGGYSARSRSEEERSYESENRRRDEMNYRNHEDEEDRRRYRRRYYNEADDYDEEDRRGRSRRTGRFVHRPDNESDILPWNRPFFNPFVTPFDMQNRMGFTGNINEQNSPYNGMNNGLPKQITEPLKSAVSGQNNQTNNTANTGTNKGV